MYVDYKLKLITKEVNMIMYALIWDVYPKARLAVACTKEELEDIIAIRKDTWQECVGRDITNELHIEEFIITEEE